MYYYEVAPADRSYRNNYLLTYSWPNKLTTGQIVVVKLRAKSINAFVVNSVQKPNFLVKEMDSIISEYALSTNQVLFFQKLNEYYPGTIGATASLFLPNKLSSIKNIAEITKDIVAEKTTSLTPSNDQAMIINKILDSKKTTHIIHGDTGTGKTLIYLELCAQIISSKKSVIILTPEISLTPQLFEQFFIRFKNVYLIHSKMTDSERRKTWQKIYKSNQPVIIIGPRSALFMPVKNLGMVIIDEFHDSAYKQDQAPKFQTTKVAGILANITSSKLVLGSATPPIEDYFYATKKGSPVYRLTTLPGGRKIERDIKIIKTNDQNETTSYGLMSKTLIDAIGEELTKGQQSMVFLNRRGTSRTVTCQKCGWIANCERCNIPYIYHHDKYCLICHVCNSKKAPISKCPTCNSNELHFKNPGTKQIETNIKNIFPKAIIGRYDKDNTKNETFFANQSDIASGKIDILIGTQLLTKGHDLPKLGLVGVLNTESGLQFPDYSAAEKNFQTIHQVIGRVGRGHSKGKVILQTYNDKTTLAHIAEQKSDAWLSFYKDELSQREKYNYPPFCFMLKIELSRSSEQNLIKNCDKLVDQIKEKNYKVQIIGPAPALIDKRNNKYYWQIIIKSKNRKVLASIIDMLPKNCSFDLDPINLL